MDYNKVNACITTINFKDINIEKNIKESKILMDIVQHMNFDGENIYILNDKLDTN